MQQLLFLKGTDWGTFCSKLLTSKASFFQGLLKAFLFPPIFGCHLLDMSTVLREWIWIRDYCILLAALCSSIQFVHLKCLSASGGKAAWAEWLVENKKGLATWMCFFKYRKWLCSSLVNKLFAIPQSVPIGSWVDICRASLITSPSLPNTTKRCFQVQWNSEGWIIHP